eukprot:1160543-Pelagomonas_calceolata.AAC.4
MADAGFLLLPRLGVHPRFVGWAGSAHSSYRLGSASSVGADSFEDASEDVTANGRSSSSSSSSSSNGSASASVHMHATGSGAQSQGAQPQSQQQVRQARRQQHLLQQQHLQQQHKATGLSPSGRPWLSETGGAASVAAAVRRASDSCGYAREMWARDACLRRQQAWLPLCAGHRTAVGMREAAWCMRECGQGMHVCAGSQRGCRCVQGIGQLWVCASKKQLGACGNVGGKGCVCAAQSLLCTRNCPVEGASASLTLSVSEGLLKLVGVRAGNRWCPGLREDSAHQQVEVLEHETRDGTNGSSSSSGSRAAPNAAISKRAAPSWQVCNAVFNKQQGSTSGYYPEEWKPWVHFEKEKIGGHRPIKQLHVPQCVRQGPEDSGLGLGISLGDSVGALSVGTSFMRAAYWQMKVVRGMDGTLEGFAQPKQVSPHIRHLLDKVSQAGRGTFRLVALFAMHCTKAGTSRSKVPITTALTPAAHLDLVASVLQACHPSLCLSIWM